MHFAPLLNWGLRKYAGEQDSIWGGKTDCQHEWGELRKTIKYHSGETNPGLEAHFKDNGANDDISFCSLCGAWRGAYGLEPTVEMYVAHSVEIFREVKRVLRKDGVFFLNCGDSYAGGKGQSGSRGAEYQDARHESGESLNTHYQTMGGAKQTKPTDDRKALRESNIKPKDLCLIPFRVAIAAQEDGWWIRSVIIWSKKNPMPESVTDRPTESHEYILMLTKSTRYYWDAEAVRTTSQGLRDWTKEGGSINNNTGWTEGALGKGRWQGERGQNFDPCSANLKSVWTFPTQPYSDWGYDYAGADYVGDDGKPYKLSLDCPVHERHPEKGIQKRASYDEQLNHRENGIIDNSNGHALTPESESSSTLDPGVVKQVVANVDEQTLGNIPAHKTSDEDKAEIQIISHIADIQTIPVSSMDSVNQDFVQTATESSKKSRKKGRVPLTSQPYNASLEKDYHIVGKLIQPSLIDSVAHTSENNTSVDSVSSEKEINPLDGTLFRNAHKSYSNYICNCRISQTSHFATFPEALPERCIKAATPEVGCCSKCGRPWVRITETMNKTRTRLPEAGGIDSKIGTKGRAGESETKTLGWQPGCKCVGAEKVPSIVLDCFGGSGTSALVATKLGRNSVTYELSEEYCKLIIERNRQSCLMV